MAEPLKVLIIDDEPLVTIFLEEVVRDVGHVVAAVCHDGPSALEAIKTIRPDVIFMDINIKGPLDGISVIRNAQLRDAVVYYISAYSDKEIIDDALSTNPYNYLIKPIKEQEVRIALALARRRSGTPAERSDKIFLGGGTCYDPAEGEVYRGDAAVMLTQKEKQLIALLARNVNRILSTEVIKEALWEGKEVQDSTMRTFISSLRQKIPQVKIKTSFGQGYMLAV